MHDMEDIDIGLTAPEFIQGIPKLLPEIEALTFNSYTPCGGVVARIATSNSKSRGGWNYWERIAEEYSSNADAKTLIDKLTVHDAEIESKNRRIINVSEINNGWIKKAIHELSDKSVLAICSKCVTKDNKTAHIPMIDFSCPINERNRELVRIAAEKLGRGKGVLLESGQSFHYYGLYLLDENDWIKFTANSLLLSPLTDSRYIAHRLISGMAVLRLTGSDQKPIIPKVVEIITGR